MPLAFTGRVKKNHYLYGHRPRHSGYRARGRTHKQLPGRAGCVLLSRRRGRAQAEIRTQLLTNTTSLPGDGAPNSPETFSFTVSRWAVGGNW